MLSRSISIKEAPSVKTDTRERGRKLTLKAANDNRPPLSHRIRSFLFYLAPVVGISIFAAIWALS